MRLDLFEETIHSRVCASKSAVVEFKVQLGYVNFAGFALVDVSFEVCLRVSLECKDQAMITGFSAVLGISGMRPAVFAAKAHNNDVREVRDARLAHFHLSRHQANMAVNFEDGSLPVEKLLLLHPLVEVNRLEF